MSVGKFTSLEEVRKDPKLLKQFIREREKDGQGIGDEDRMEATLGSMLRTTPTDAKTSPAASDADCSGTQTPPGTSPDASGKR